MTPAEFREKMADKDLMQVADEMAKTVTIRTYGKYGSNDASRKSTPEEQTILSNVIYSALLAYYHRDNADIHSILDVAEYMVLRSLPGVNTYDTVYIPIRNITETW